MEFWIHGRNLKETRAAWDSSGNMTTTSCWRHFHLALLRIQRFSLRIKIFSRKK